MAKPFPIGAGTQRTLLEQIKLELRGRSMMLYGMEESFLDHAALDGTELTPSEHKFLNGLRSARDHCYTAAQVLQEIENAFDAS